MKLIFRKILVSYRIYLIVEIETPPSIISIIDLEAPTIAMIPEITLELVCHSYSKLSLTPDLLKHFPITSTS